MFCTKCGAKNPDGAKFCTSCGSPIPEFQPGPVEPAETVEPVKQVIEPVEAAEPDGPASQHTYADTQSAYIPPADDLERRFFGKKADYYLRKRDKMAASNSNTSWNWAGFWLTYFWAFYRKMYALGGILFGLSALVSILGTFIDIMAHPAVSMAISLLYAVFVGLVGNYMYLNHADKCLAEARQMPPQEQDAYIAKKGGTSIGPVILVFVVVLILSGIRYAVMYQKVYDELLAAYGVSNVDNSSYGTSEPAPASTPDPAPDPTPAPASNATPEPAPAQNSSTGEPSATAIADALAEIVPPFIVTPGPGTTFDWYDGSHTSGYATVYPQSTSSGAFTVSGTITIVLTKLDDGSWFAENYDPQCFISYNYADEYYDNAGMQGFYMESSVEYGNGYAWTTVTPLNFAGGSDPTGDDLTCYWWYSDADDGSVYMLSDGEQIAIYFDAQMAPVSFYLA